MKRINRKWFGFGGVMIVALSAVALVMASRQDNTQAVFTSTDSISGQVRAATFTPTNTPTFTPTNTPTNTPTHTPTFTPTNTPTFTPTFTPTPTSTNTPVPTPTTVPGEVGNNELAINQNSGSQGGGVESLDKIPNTGVDQIQKSSSQIWASLTPIYKVGGVFNPPAGAVPWSVVLVLDDTTTATTFVVDIWWENGSCSSSAVALQLLAHDTISVPGAMVAGFGYKFDVTATTLTPHTFVAGDLLCLKIANLGSNSNQTVKTRTGTASTTGFTGVQRLIGPICRSSTGCTLH